MAGETHLIRAYGDRRDDGVIQLSFTLPVPLSDKAKEAARRFCTQLGLLDVKVAAAEPAADNYTFFVVYGRADVSLDYAGIDVPEIVFRKLGFDDLNKLIEDRIARRVVVLGACTGTDTHTVGIDAILNMKGYSGDYGLERYPWFEAYNLGSQVPNEELIRKAEERKADAILVSQVVTQRVDHKLALELGFDAGFGPGTKPSDVANYIVHALLKKMGKEPEDLHFEGEPG